MVRENPKFDYLTVINKNYFEYLTVIKNYFEYLTVIKHYSEGISYLFKCEYNHINEFWILSFDFTVKIVNFSIASSPSA